MSILFSIIVPVFNTEKYLRECIESILIQEFVEYEVILVNDGSTDTSKVICEDYASKYEHIKVYNKVNGGVGSARNIGMEKAVGKYLLFLDSDDCLLRNSLNRIYELLIQDGDCDLMFLGGLKGVSLDESVEYEPCINRKDIWGKSKEMVLKYIQSLSSFPGAVKGLLVNRNFLMLTNLKFDVKYIIHEDMVFCLQLYLYANIFDIYWYRKGVEGSLTYSLSSEKYSSVVSSIDDFLLFADTKYKEYVNFIYSVMAYQYCILVYLYSQLNKSDKLRYKKVFKSFFWLHTKTNRLDVKLVFYITKIFGVGKCSIMLKLYALLNKGVG